MRYRDSTFWCSSMVFVATTVPSTSMDTAKVLVHLCHPFSSLEARGGTSFYSDFSVSIETLFYLKNKDTHRFSSCPFQFECLHGMSFVTGTSRNSPLNFLPQASLDDERRCSAKSELNLCQPPGFAPNFSE